MFEASRVLDPEFSSHSLDSLWQAITDNYTVDEAAYLEELMKLYNVDTAAIADIDHKTQALITAIRDKAKGGDGIDAFLQQYSLDTQEGIVLMCLAEALLRIPDGETADALIQDRLGLGEWKDYKRKSESLLVNTGTFALNFANNVINPGARSEHEPISYFRRMVQRLGLPVVRRATYQAMKIMGTQFVLGRTISEALKNSRSNREQGYTHSYDMLGEAALTADDATRYAQAYLDSIHAIAKTKLNNPDVARPTISIKLSALHPRYEVANRDRVLNELVKTVTHLVKVAKESDVGITIDAEEMDRLELSLELFQKIYQSGLCKGWPYFGLVVQAYSKRALPVLCWLNALAKENGDEIPVRLVKGAYWDTELKLAQQMGFSGYPLFTRKASTDVSYLACAKYLLSADVKGNIYPQFATHNAHTISAIHQLATHPHYEFQRLHGMGKDLYDQVIKENPSQTIRIYAPVGAHKDLLPYLVRRLLENGANSSFVHKLLDPKVAIHELAQHPISILKNAPSLANHKIPLPKDIYQVRQNSKGVNLNIRSEGAGFIAAVQAYKDHQWHGGPLVNGALVDTEKNDVFSPQNVKHKIGTIGWADEALSLHALEQANLAFPSWRDTPVEVRASYLEALADKIEENIIEFIALCSFEAGKTFQDGIDEVREAVDFCRYYALQARRIMGQPHELIGPTGETNTLFVHGRGTFLCISPWNFPLAIFLGQVTAALVAGNCVLAKSAETTGLVAYRAVQMAHEVGIPGEVLQFLPGRGRVIGNTLTQENSLAGVCFTGSTGTAQTINKALAARTGAIIPFVAETGGQNTMIVDSTALPEQAVTDIVASAFKSAGQRCSALRVLYIQEEIADRVISLIQGAVKELSVGNPLEYKTDVGPVINKAAKDGLDAHIKTITQTGKLVAQAPMSADTSKGSFVIPTAIEIDSISQLDQEHFGPILHIVRFKRKDLDKVIDDINGTGFGLTFGIHSRNESFFNAIAKRLNVGNVYINRNQVGAVVGVQPFGGRGLSGTGPKAGGPHYLYSFITEKVITDNITAIGGNASLLSLGDD